MVFHVLNRGVGRRNLFDKADDFEAFERVLKETLQLRSMRVCGYCWMSNHWHFVLWPEHDGDLPAFMQRLTNTHVKRWKEHRHETGYGPILFGTRFASRNNPQTRQTLARDLRDEVDRIVSLSGWQERSWAT
jgi:putative transposase